MPSVLAINIVSVILPFRSEAVSTYQYEQPMVMLSDISHGSKERATYESAEVDHEYEMLDKYNQPYDEVRIPEAPPPKEKQQQGDDYELTQCPAYIPVATSPGVNGKERTISSTDEKAPNS